METLIFSMCIAICGVVIGYILGYNHGSKDIGQIYKDIYGIKEY